MQLDTNILQNSFSDASKGIYKTRLDVIDLSHEFSFALHAVKSSLNQLLEYIDNLVNYDEDDINTPQDYQEEIQRTLFFVKLALNGEHTARNENHQKLFDLYQEINSNVEFADISEPVSEPKSNFKKNEIFIRTNGLVFFGYAKDQEVPKEQRVKHIFLEGLEDFDSNGCVETLLTLLTSYEALYGLEEPDELEIDGPIFSDEAFMDRFQIEDFDLKQDIDPILHESMMHEFSTIISDYIQGQKDIYSSIESFIRDYDLDDEEAAINYHIKLIKNPTEGEVS